MPILVKTIDPSGKSVRMVLWAYQWGVWHPNSSLAKAREKKVSKAVAKVRKKKSSRSGTSLHESEILRAKQAVSAALIAESAPAAASKSGASASSSGTAGLGGVMKGLVRAAANIVGQGAETGDRAGVVYSVSTSSANPLADLAGRHIRESNESLSRLAGTSDPLCRKVLANLARARLDNTEESFSQSRRT